MEPIPPTVLAIEHLDRLGETRVEEALRRIADEVLVLVPQCVGLSLTLVEDGVTLTLAAAGLDTLPLDAMQYLDGGPCVDAVEDNAPLVTNLSDPLSEQRWSMFARESAARGVQSSLSMPLLEDDVAVGGVNFYGSTPDAFDGHEDQVAHLVGASAGAAVRDADLDFSTRLQAGEAPEQLAKQADVDLAVGFVASSQGVDTETARQRLRDAATRAGVSELEVAHSVIRTHLPEVR